MRVWETARSPWNVTPDANELSSMIERRKNSDDDTLASKLSGPNLGVLRGNKVMGACG